MAAQCATANHRHIALLQCHKLGPAHKAQDWCARSLCSTHTRTLCHTLYTGSTKAHALDGPRHHSEHSTAAAGHLLAAVEYIP